jgi:hypothetical protein
MAKTKAKTVKVRVAVIYDERRYQAGGYWVRGVRPSDRDLIEDARQFAPSCIERIPGACVVDIELPLPLKGKVLSVKAATP